MSKKSIQPLVCMAFLALTASTEISAKNIDNITTSNSVNEIVSSVTELVTSQVTSISVRRGEKYDESKDPALRRGTENEEQPQGSFFAIPAFVVGVILLFLFFNRDK